MVRRLKVLRLLLRDRRVVPFNNSHKRTRRPTAKVMRPAGDLHVDTGGTSYPSPIENNMGKRDCTHTYVTYSSIHVYIQYKLEKIASAQRSYKDPQPAKHVRSKAHADTMACLALSAWPRGFKSLSCLVLSV